MSGRWLRLAQTAWLLVALFYALSFLLALPIMLHQPAGTLGFPGWTELETAQALAQLGWSADSLQRYLNVVNLLGVPAYMLVGAFIFWRRSNDPMALTLSITYFIFLGTAQFKSLAQLAPIWTHVEDFSGGLATTLFFLVFVIFPDGRFVPRWTRWAALVVADIQLFRVFRPDVYAPLEFVVALPFVAIQTLAQLYRFVRVSGPVQRQQTKWVVFGLTAGTLPLLAYFLLIGLVPALTLPTASGMVTFVLGTLLWNFVLVALLVSLTIAILRSRLFDIDVIIRRTLIYAALTGLLALAYFGSIVVLQNIFGALTGQRQSTLVTVLSTLVIAALFVPLRRRVQAVIDQRLFRRKYDAAKTLAVFGATLRDEVELRRLSEQLVGVVDETMQPASVALWLKPTTDKRPGAPA